MSSATEDLLERVPVLFVQHCVDHLKQSIESILALIRPVIKFQERLWTMNSKKKWTDWIEGGVAIAEPEGEVEEERRGHKFRPRDRRQKVHQEERQPARDERPCKGICYAMNKKLGMAAGSPDQRQRKRAL